MSEPVMHLDDSCSYERRRQRRQTWIQRRHQLLLLGVWLGCSAFTWPGRVPHLRYQAAHGSVPERVEALRLLEEYPLEDSRDACLAGLEDGASEVRVQAAQCVGAGRDERATSNLLDLAGARDPLERTAAVEALGRLAPARALPSIEQALADPQPLVRVAAVRALTAYVRDGLFDDAKLAPLLGAEQVEVRLTAIEVLDAATSDDAAKASATSPARALQLRAAARDRAAEVRAAALRVIGRTRDAKLLPDLSAGVSDPDEAVRLSAIAALGDSNLAGATAALRSVSASKSSQAAQLRAARTALAALGRIDDASALPPIASALTRPELTQSAVNALLARARRLTQPANAKQSAEALQHAIDTLPTVPANAPAPGTEPSSARPETPNANAARDSLARPETPNANAARGSLARPETPNANAARDSLARADKGVSLGPADAAMDALARGVLELASVHDVQGAVLSLVRALEAGRGDVYSLTQHLVALGAQADARLLSALLKREASPRSAAAVITLLKASPDARALVATHREQLRRIAEAHPATAIELHALLHVAETETSLEARRALTRLWADQPALATEREPLEKLLHWLDDADPEVREHSSIALSRAADATALEALSARLARSAPYPELTLRACAGVMRQRDQIPSALRERLLQQFQSHLNKPDETVAMNALFALRASNEQRSAPWIAGLLRGSSPQLRAAAIQALSGFDQPEARRMLRDMLRGDNVQNASNAALALAELGSDRDVEALLRAAERGSWPLPPAAAYASARITARGVTRKHSLERVLCRFAQLRDSYVLSNIVSALATLGAAACDEQIQPKNLLDPTLPSALRVAAALWLQSTRPHSPQDTSERSTLLARCANDHDAAVAAACSHRAAQQESRGQTLLRVLEPDARSVLSDRVVALRQPDGTVFVGASDHTGHVLLPRAAAGELRLEDPADQGPLVFPARLTTPASQ